MKCRLPIIFFLLQLVIVSCDKPDNDPAYSQILGFDSSKCFCCWGWVIKHGRDTLKTDGLPPEFTADTNFPVNVKLTPGAKSLDCSPIEPI